MSLQLNNLDLKQLTPGSSSVIIGKRRSGKTVAILDLLKHFNVNYDIKNYFICSYAEEIEQIYINNNISKEFIFDNCAEMSKKIVERQTKLLEENEQLKQEGKPLKDMKIVVVLDDFINETNIINKNNIVSEYDIYNDINFQKMIINSNIYQITFIISIQYTQILNLNIIKNINYVFISNNDIKDEIHKIYNLFGNMFSTYHLFKRILNTYTRNYNMLVLDVMKLNEAPFCEKVKLFKANY